MRAYGSDRLRLREDGAAILSCRVPKNGWQPRIAKTLTSPVHPGTAILCEGEYWEVIDVQVLQAGVRYTLEKWPEASAAAMPLVDRYDEEREVERALDRKRIQASEKGRVAANLLAIFTGHLPANVQSRLAGTININPVRLTMISAVPPFAAFAGLVYVLVGNVTGLGQHHRIPMLLALIVAYLGVDSLVRFLWAMSLGKPCGSVFGLVGYTIFYALSPKKPGLVRPMDAERGSSVKTTQLTDDMKKESDVTAIEPLLSLLDEADQQRLAEKYGVDYRRTAKTVATVIMIFSLLGVVTAIPSILQLHLSGLMSLVVAGFLFLEQLIRYPKLAAGPSSSVLRFLVRPLVARYLA